MICCLDSARETKEYENAFLDQQISFLEFMQDYFASHRLRHVQKVYDDRMRGFARVKRSGYRYFMTGALRNTRSAGKNDQVPDTVPGPALFGINLISVPAIQRERSLSSDT